MIRTQIQITETQARQLEGLARRERVSKAELIRRALDAYLRGQSDLSPAERRLRAKAVVGSFRSGLKDVSKRHDKYLAEAFGE